MVRRRKAPERAARDAGAGRAAAFAVHVLTACGAACALMALLAVSRRDFTAMFAWLGLALAIDGIDGSLARGLDVARRLPRWSGAALDLAVDFANYVLVPAYALVVSGLLPHGIAIPLGAAIVVTGALYCGDGAMKDADNCFRGFPVLWNLAALHFFVLQAPAWANAAATAILLVLTFAPYRTVHPLRVRRLRGISMAALAAWSALALYALYHDLEPEWPAALAMAVLAVYFLAIGIVLPRPVPEP